MSRPRRLEYPGSLWHITARGNNRQLIFSDESDHKRFLQWLGDSVRRFGWIVPAYVLMPNHYHLVVQLADPTLSRGMQWLNGRYAAYFNRRHSRVGHLFQARYKSFLIDKEAYGLEVLRYVVLNPVRARMATRPEQYEWSSHRAVLGEASAPDWLAVDDTLVAFGTTRDQARSNYRQFVDDAIRSGRRLWDGLVGQMYLGRDEWIESVLERAELKPRSQEHAQFQTRPHRGSIADVIGTVADIFSVPRGRIHNGRGGAPRMVVAWIGWNEARLTGRQIATGLGLRGVMQVTRLVRACDREMQSNRLLRQSIDVYRSTTGGKKDKG